MKLFFDSGDYLIERRKISIMGAQPSRELPHAFDGIEFRTVGRKEDECAIFLTQLSPFLVQLGVMEAGIVENDHDLPIGTNGSPSKFFEECRKSLSVECFHLSTPDKLAIAESHGPEIPDTFPCRRVQKYRIFDLRWNPHLAGCSMLLEVHFIEHPHIDTWICEKFFQFFLKSSCFSGSPCASAGRGFRKRKPSFLNNRWHWRTPRRTPCVERM